MKKLQTALSLIVIGSLFTGCASEANRSVQVDSRGHYASTADYNAMERDEFNAAMQAGMLDFDQQLASLKTQASALGPDAMEEYVDDLEELTEARRVLEAEIAMHDAMLDEEWRDHREDVAEQYIDLRESLDDTFDEVVEEG